MMLTTPGWMGGITQERQNKLEQVQTHAIGNGTQKHIWTLFRSPLDPFKSQCFITKSSQIHFDGWITIKITICDV